MILDTNFIIDFLNGRKEAVAKMSSLEGFAITSITVFEVWSGLISLSKSDKNRLTTKEFFSGQTIYNLNAETAQEAGRIHGELIKKGLEIQAEDCMIAGIAIKNNEIILTKDEHFRRIDELKIESY